MLGVAAGAVGVSAKVVSPVGAFAFGVANLAGDTPKTWKSSGCGVEEEKKAISQMR
jgi:hypothetical protein